MFSSSTLVEWIFGIILILSSLGVVLASKPVHASLSFLVTLMTLALLYLQLSAEFIAILQVLVYAGAILVIFMFVIILFQDAYQQIQNYPARSYSPFLYGTAAAFIITLIFISRKYIDLIPMKKPLPEGFGTVQALGQLLYIDFFFPFEAVLLLFLIAVVGSFYIAKRVR